jgi:TatD DNase family protein
LDYHYEEAAYDREVQKRLLREFLELAVKMDMPVSFHVREAFADFWPILDEFEGKVRGVLHSFTGTREEMEEGLRRGFYIGVNGIVTFAESVREVVRECPLERVILETDAPWLAPVPYRGEQNQPGNLRAVGEFLAKLYGVSLEEVERVTTENVMKIFWGRE